MLPNLRFTANQSTTSWQIAGQVLFDGLSEREYRLSDAEAKVFLPGLVEKSGQPQAQLRSDCR